MMDNEFVECMKIAKKKNDMSYLIKGNGIKRTSDELRKDMFVLEKEVTDLQGKKRKLC